MRDYKRFLDEVYDADPELSNKLPAAGGLRALFSPCSGEYKRLSERERAQLVQRFLRIGWTPLKLLPWFEEECKRVGYGNEDFSWDMTSALSRTLEWCLTDRSVIEQLGELVE